MSKNSVSEWSTVSSGNGDIAGLTLGLDMPPSYVNNAIQEMMAQIKQWKDGYTDPITGLPVYQSLTVENITVEGIANFKGSLTLDGNQGTLGQVLVSQGSSETPTWGDAFVSGMIMMWAGTIATIPSGWRICDGNVGTPDLTNRFVIGAGNGHVEGAIGGYRDSVVVYHNHTGIAYSNGSHVHGGVPAKFSDVDRGLGTPSAFSLDTVGSTAAAGDHHHALGIDTAGESGINKNLPPYYALAYIMKL